MEGGCNYVCEGKVLKAFGGILDGPQGVWEETAREEFERVKVSDFVDTFAVLARICFGRL